MSQHAAFPPSRFALKALCPASHREEFQYKGEEKVSEKAIFGTHTHTLVEMCADSDFNNPKIYKGLTLTDHEGSFEVTMPMVRYASVMIYYLLSKIKANRDLSVYSETRSYPGKLLFRDDWWGSLDAAIINTHTKQVEVSDFKTGRMPVSPIESWQGISYLLGVLADPTAYGLGDVAYPELMNYEVKFSIVQPSLMAESTIDGIIKCLDIFDFEQGMLFVDKGFSTWSTQAGNLMSYLSKAADIIEACLADEPEYRPSKQACEKHYCKHRNNCTARTKVAVQATANLPADSGLILPPTLPPVAEMSAHQIAKVLDYLEVFQGWTKDVEKEGMKRAKSGQTIPGRKLIETKGKRAWIDDVSQVVKTLTTLTVDGVRPFRKKDVVVEKLISFTEILGNPTLTERQKTKIETNLMTPAKTGLKLVPESDPGAPCSPADQFNEISLQVDDSLLPQSL